MRATDWTKWLAYKCRHCRDDCINRRDSSATEAQECWDCHKLPCLGDLPADRSAETADQLAPCPDRREGYPYCGAVQACRECRMPESPARAEGPRPEQSGAQAERARSGQRAASGNGGPADD